MQIKVLRIKKLSSDSKLKAFADVSFGEKIIVNGCQVFQGPNGLFVGLPSAKSAKDGKYYPIVKLVDSSDVSALNDVVMKSYNEGSQVAATVTNESEVPF